MRTWATSTWVRTCMYYSSMFDLPKRKCSLTPRFRLSFSLAPGQQTVVVVQQAGDASVDASADSCSVIMFVLGIFFPLLCL